MHRTLRAIPALLTLCLIALSASADGPSSEKGSHATGVFEVKTRPLNPPGKTPDAIGKFALDKAFHGDLEATSKGAMLSTGSANGNGAYVALEIVTGKLKGREGSFVLQHTGIATQGGSRQLNIIVVPNSGTGGLAHLSGKMNIEIADGKHSYDLEYSLGDAP